MQRAFSALSFALLMLATGCTHHEVTLGHSQRSQQNQIVSVSSLGVRSRSTLRTVASVRNSNQLITLHGTMIEKCPVAGCWFVLRDKTGTIRVDTKAAGFSVGAIALQTPVTVSGNVMESDGVKSLQATTLRY